MIDVDMSSALTYDRALGAVFKLAIGDVIGGPTEMAMVLGRHLLDNGSFDKERLLAVYLTWWKKSGFDTGTTTAKVFSLICSGWPYQQATKKVYASSPRGSSAGCNPMHRSLILASASSIVTEDLARISREEASLTHQDALAAEVAARSNTFYRHLILGDGIEGSLARVLEPGKADVVKASADGLGCCGFLGRQTTPVW
jgi:ADP-ribosylglycohydrolase